MYYSAPQLSRHLLSSYPAAPTSSPISLYYWWSKSDSIQCNDRHLFFLPTFVLQCKKNLSFLLFLLIVLLSVLFNNSSPVVSEEGRVKRARREARLVIEGEKEGERAGWINWFYFVTKKKAGIMKCSFSVRWGGRTEGIKEECKAKVNEMRQKEMTKQRNEVIKKWKERKYHTDRVTNK